MVMTLNEQELLRLLPAIRRARDFHLYDASGKRYLDLYQQGGRAWLGHRPEGLSLQIKNTLSRGVYSPYPGSEEGKLIKALRALLFILPGSAEFHNLRYYSASHQDFLPDAVDPLFHQEGPCTLWRPALDWPDKAGSVEMLIPLPGFEYGRIIATRNENLPQGDIPSPVIAAALLRCVWVLKKTLETAAPVHDFSIPEAAPWSQSGPYCLFKGNGDENADDYKEMFIQALKAGILLPPSASSPCILPGILTSGDTKLLKQFFGGLS